MKNPSSTARPARRPHPVGLGFAALAAAATLVFTTTPGHAQDAAALVDKLVQKGILTSQEGADVRADMQKEFSQSPAGKINLSNSVTQLQLYGDLRLRYQYNNVEPEPGASIIATQQDRYRYRLRLNADVQLGKDFFGGIQLQTGQTSDSGNQTYSNGFNNDSIFISRAFLGWQNDWLKIIAGKQANPFYTTDLVWDPDINPAGLTETVAFHRMPIFGGSAGPDGDGKTVAVPAAGNPWEVSLVAGQFILGDNSSFASLKTNSNDPWIFDQQLIVKYKFNKDTSITFAPGFLSENSAHITGALNTLPFSDEGAIVLNNNTITTTVAQVDVVSVKYSALGVPTKTVTPTTVTTTNSTAVAPVVASGQPQPTDTKSTANAIVKALPVVTVGKATGLPTDPSKANQTLTTTVTNSTATASKTTTNTLPAVAAESAGLHILTAPGDISFSLGGIKSKVYWDVAYNVSGQDRYNDVYQLKDYGNQAFRPRDGLAWMVGIQFGEIKKRGDWQAFVNYRQTGIASVDPNLNDNEIAAGALNMRGFKFSLAYALTDFAILQATGYIYDSLDKGLSGGRATSVGGVAPYSSYNEATLEMNLKF